MSERNVERLVRKYIDKRDDKLVDIVERCIRKGYDYEKMKGRIGEHVRDSSTRKRLVEALSDAFPQFARKSKQPFEERKEVREEERKEKRPKLQELPVSTVPSSAPSILIAPKLATLPLKVEPKNEEVTEEELRSKELMYQAQMAIEERKRQLNLTAKPGIVAQTVISKASKLNVKEASMFMNYSMEKINRLVFISHSTTDILVVKELKEKLARSTALPQLAKKQIEKVKTETEQKIVEYLDPRISLKSAQRKPRAIVFHEKGEFETLAHRERAKARLAMLQSEISHIAKRTGMSSSVKLAMLTPSSASTAVEVPDIEWWDEIVIGAPTYNSIPDADLDVDERYKKSITNLVEHPIQLKPPDEPLHPQYLKPRICRFDLPGITGFIVSADLVLPVFIVLADLVYLTSKERKKIRRQNRKEAQKEQTEKIRLGLAKAPEPKVKLSNLMRVLGSEAVQDPTKMEAHVRKQMAERQRKHESANAQRKLTKEQRSEKKAKKIKEDTSLCVHVAVYRLKSLSHPAKKFKVEMNAKQLHMTGLILLHANINLVVVEGGPKQQKAFKNLMLNRIKWADEIIGQKKEAEDKDAPGERNQCFLVWEGVTKKRNFGEVKCISATLEKQARELLEKHEVAHYWDLAYSTSLLKDE
ncbi:U4/U6 small nuclear ribonucleoprotein Prp3 [Toxocara canis]|uniref:U4/U6 small nuclear ribonucleoprotein Prp3 n=1 Tax=Toxocara canis TaxID=6265 RepID=A0A0B2VXN7_TOXCA|nr:U4/U6 small nuclear ribonucleoprotein Prp3 [Toxocara canis]